MLYTRLNCVLFLLLNYLFFLFFLDI